VAEDGSNPIILPAGGVLFSLQGKQSFWQRAAGIFRANFQKVISS